jgi:hypothetical protein
VEKNTTVVFPLPLDLLRLVSARAPGSGSSA